MVVWTLLVIALLWESKWFLGKMTGALEEYMGDVAVCDKCCLGAVWTCSLLSHDESTFPGGRNSLGSDPWQLNFLWRRWEITPFRVPSGRWEEFRESPCLPLLIFKCLQLTSFATLYYLPLNTSAFYFSSLHLTYLLLIFVWWRIYRQRGNLWV